MTCTCLTAAIRPEFNRSLKRTLEPDFEVVAMVDNAVSLQESLKALAPRLAVVDLEVLGLNPWPLVSVLRRSAPGLCLIVLSSQMENSQSQAAVHAGVDALLDRSAVGKSLLRVALEGMESSQPHSNSPGGEAPTA